MDNYIKKHLQDIITAIEEIESFFENQPKLFEEFNRDLRLRRAVERNVEIIGEAMNRILKVNSDITITNSRKIVDARNYIIHGYDSLSIDILWSIVVNHLPKLKQEAIALLKSE
ncbi:MULTISPECIES: HepT-like ribonuclease domain-containing protein [Parabacteroides]|jgi:uncharacterized protein with HEPN domain|uniref:Uncharacterized protein with HEPN domain n=1 Tax=Parabacteroides faecis TaxID=1217282 RepID=A0ABR6KIJ5_9BACT|nr:MULTISPECIES: HepT-like ribonuclease domain-containing protein [Parabacteroides]MBB4620638.1 uncharacterized protein with HEPN domain [Parabacteroides faecis]RHU24231.1 DUF86 domain-containing protein [Parabacteroides sp. TM07-1AC]WFE86861.1 DUF86 domain-containing protein [Parabacteroides chongii]GGJ90183.1 antitoxin [Parabacteroides faecis]